MEHIKLLAIFSYVFGGLTALGGCMGFIYIILGSIFASNSKLFVPLNGSGAQAMPPQFGWIFIVIGCLIIVVGWTLAGLNIYSGRSMQQRKRRVFSLSFFLVAGMNCVSFPLGTALGVFTFIVLLRDSVARMYQYAEGQTRT